MSESYYDEYGQAFAAATKDLKMNDLYAPFLEHVPPSGTILDAGCGSGRDVKAFTELGYKVAAFDASPAMVAIAKEFSQQEISIGTFQQLDYDNTFDGIWACASLLHVPLAEIDDVFVRLGRALKKGGVLYMSFKKGAGESVRHGRTFTSFNQDSLDELLKTQSHLRIVKIWLTGDIRSERAAEYWVNALVMRN